MKTKTKTINPKLKTLARKGYTIRFDTVVKTSRSPKQTDNQYFNLKKVLRRHPTKRGPGRKQYNTRGRVANAYRKDRD